MLTRPDMDSPVVESRFKAATAASAAGAAVAAAASASAAAGAAATSWHVFGINISVGHQGERR